MEQTRRLDPAPLEQPRPRTASGPCPRRDLRHELFVDFAGAADDLRVAFVGEVVLGACGVDAVGGFGRFEGDAYEYRDDEVDGEGDDADVDGHLGVEADVVQRVGRSAEVDLLGGRVGDAVEHPHAGRHAGRPAGDQAAAVEPAGDQAEGHRRQRLQDDDAADELQVDGELRVEQQDGQDGADLDDEGGEFADGGLFGVGGVAADVFLVDVAGEQVGGGDGHDRGGDEGADADGGVGDAGEPAGEDVVEQQGDDGVAVGFAVGAGDRLDAGGDRHEAEQRDQPEQEAVRRQGGHVPLDDVAVLAGQHAGDAVGVQEQRERRAERQHRVVELVVVVEERAVRRGGRLVELGVRRAEDVAPAAQFVRDVDDRDDDHDVDERVLDERDEGGCAQAGLVGVGGQDAERDDQRPVALDAHGLQRRLDADELQRDVGHGRHDAGDRDQQGEGGGPVPGPDEVARGDEPVDVETDQSRIRTRKTMG